ncbi:MAG: chitinase [Cytophagales bacterium]|nr:chitinase [Cytophagales bacterium]
MRSNLLFLGIFTVVFLIYLLPPTTPITDPQPNSQARLHEFFTASDFSALFPDSVYYERGRYWVDARNQFYTYEDFIEAASHFPSFCNTGSLEVRKRELAAFLANTAHETKGGSYHSPKGPYYYGYYFVREHGCYNKKTGKEDCPHYINTHSPLGRKYPPHPGQQYYGRGPIQLSYNYNYGKFSNHAGLGSQLLEAPDLLAQNGVLSFRSAIWFWMTPQGAKPSCHQAMTGQWVPNRRDSLANRKPGFGLTINIINGRGECGRGFSKGARSRLGFYKRFVNYFQVDKGEYSECGSMKAY